LFGEQQQRRGGGGGFVSDCKLVLGHAAEAACAFERQSRTLRNRLPTARILRVARYAEFRAAF